MLVVWMLLPTVLLWAVLHAPDVARPAARAVRRAWRGHPSPTPSHPPIERLASDLRRLRRQLDRIRSAGPLPGKGTRWTSLLLAYDDVLVDACSALGIEHRLRSGWGGADERRRVERALTDAGLVL